MLATQPTRHPSEERSDATDMLNAVAFTGVHLEAALEALASLPGHLQKQPHAQALALRSYAAEAGHRHEHAAAALHARITALAKWTAAHDPERQSDPKAVFEAAARYPLSEGDFGIEFEPSGFQELVLFVEDLPF